MGSAQRRAIEAERRRGLSVEERVREVVCEAMGSDPSKVTPEAHLVEDLWADSLDQVELAIDLEREFEVDIPDEDLHRLATVGDVVRYIEGRIEVV